MGLRTGTSRLGRGSSVARFSPDILRYWVDSAAANDTGSGLIDTAPKKTLSAVQALIGGSGGVVGLKRGSTWREQFNIPQNNVGLIVYGAGAMPVIDGADVAGAWTQPDAITYPNVWSQTWVRSSATTTGSEVLGYWEDGVRPRYATNATTDLQTNGGWFASSLSTQTTTVSIKSAADPNSDGIVREITRRHYAINGHPSTLGQIRTNQSVVGPVEFKRCVGHYNAYSGGPGTAKLMFLREGNIHHATSEGSLIEDAIGTEYSPNIAPSVFVAFKPSGIGFAPTFRRILVLMPGDTLRVVNGSAFYCHATVSREPTSLTVEGSLTRGVNFANASALALIVTGSYCEDPYQYALADGSTVTTASYFLVRDTAPTPLAAGNYLFSRGGTTSTFVLNHVASHTMKGAAMRNLTGGTKPVITNCSVNTVGATGVPAGLSGGEAAMTYSVLYTMYRPFDNVTNLYTGDYNVFYMNGGTNPTLHWGGVLYNSATTAFLDYVAASGQDTHSVYLKAADQTTSNALAFWLGIAEGGTGPAAGDFRINPACRVYDKDNVARIGVFGDGTTPITQAGPQQHYNFNTRALVAGPPSRYPVLPATVAEMRTYLESPTTWNFYP